MYPFLKKDLYNNDTIEACIKMANQLIKTTKLRIPKIVNIKNITPEFIKAVYFNLCEPQNKGGWLDNTSWEVADKEESSNLKRHRHLRWFLKPAAKKDWEMIQGVINKLEQLLGIPLSHISGADIAAGNPVSIHNLLEILLSCYHLSVISSRKVRPASPSSTPAATATVEENTKSEVLNSVPSLSEGFTNLKKTFSSSQPNMHSAVTVESLHFEEGFTTTFNWSGSKGSLVGTKEEGDESGRKNRPEVTLDPWSQDNSLYWDPPVSDSLANILSTTDIEGRSGKRQVVERRKDTWEWIRAQPCAYKVVEAVYSSPALASDRNDTPPASQSPASLEEVKNPVRKDKPKKQGPRLRVTSDLTFKIRNQLLNSRNHTGLTQEVGGYGGGPAVSLPPPQHGDWRNAIGSGPPQLTRQACPRSLGPNGLDSLRYPPDKSVEELAQVLEKTAATSQTNVALRESEVDSLRNLADTTEQLFRRLCLKKRSPITRKIYTPSCQRSVLLPRCRRFKPRDPGLQHPEASTSCWAEDELEADLRRHFPFVEVSRPTLSLLSREWHQEHRLVERRLDDCLLSQPSSKFVAEQASRQKKLSHIAQRELLSTLSLNNVRERRRLELSARSSLQTARLRNAHLKRYYQQFLCEFRRRVALTRCRGEMRVANAVRETWKNRRADIFYLCRQHADRLHQTHLDLVSRFFSLQHYYENQCSLLQEKLAQDHSTLETRIKAQRLATAQIKRELHQATEKSLRELQEQVLSSRRDLGPLEDQLKSLSLS